MKDKPFTYDDLAKKMSEYSYAKQEAEESLRLAAGARNVLASHERLAAEAQAKVETIKGIVKNILADLEK